MLLSIFLFIAAFNASAGEDSLEMRDGSILVGDIIAQGKVTAIPGQVGSIVIDSSEIWIVTANGLQKISMSEIKTIHFGPKIDSKKTTTTVDEQ